MSERLNLLLKLYTPRVRALVEHRLTNHVPLIERASRFAKKKRLEVKVALLVVHIINPFEDFFASEEALIRGIDDKTLAKRKQEGLRDPRLALKKL